MVSGPVLVDARIDPTPLWSGARARQEAAGGPRTPVPHNAGAAGTQGGVQKTGAAGCAARATGGTSDRITEPIDARSWAPATIPTALSGIATRWVRSIGSVEVSWAACPASSARAQ